MNLQQYQEAVKKLAKEFENKDLEIATWGLGIAGEAGDVAGCIKKTITHKDDQLPGIKENLGDTMWYIAMICNSFGWDLQEVLEENIAKLQKRHPQGFTEENCQKDERRDWMEK